jgi:AcrR family transcriptional regulator
MKEKNISKAAGTQQAIRKAAKRLFVERGYKGTTVRDIATHTGVTTGAIYTYYKSKDAIIIDLFQDVFSREWAMAFQLDTSCTYEEYIEMNAVMNTNLAKELGYDLLQVYFTSQGVMHDNRSLLIAMDHQGYEQQDYRLISSIRERYGLKCTSKELADLFMRAERGVFLDWIINKGNFHIGEATRQMLTPIVMGLMPRE